MRPAYPTRRRAEQFDALLEGTLTQAPTAELAQLLALAGQVRAVPEVARRAEFTASLRERLMAEAPSALATPAAADTSRLAVGHRPPSRTSRERRIGIAIAAFSLVGASAASAVASQGSLPGDTLYPVKRLIEDARTSVTMGEDAKADVLLSQARTRLEEARELGSREDPDPAAITRALRDFGDTADHASALVLAGYADDGDQKEIGELRTFAQEGVTKLSTLASLLPESLDGVLSEATDTLLTIDHSAAESCPACDGAGITELPSTLVDLLAATSDGASETAASVTRPRATTGRKASKPAAPAPSSSPTPAPGGSLLEHLTEPLTNATGGKPGDRSTGSGSGSTGVGGTVGDVGGTLGGTLGGTVGDAGDTVGGTVGGVGGVIGGTVGGVGETVDGVVGLLGGTNQSPAP